MNPKRPAKGASWRAWLRYITWDQWDAIDAEYLGQPQPPGAPAPRNQVVIVLVTAAVVLTGLEYMGSRSFFRSNMPEGLRPEGFKLLAEYAWWSFACVVGYLLIPGVIVKTVFKERLRDYGFKGKDFFKHLWIYGLLFLGVLPMVIGASLTPAFQAKYPFYKFATRSFFDLAAWEALYTAQFVALEFFFRGFLLFGIARKVGAYAIVIMAVPYCMIHFGKPVPETLGAIGAGMILGTVALRTRSIYAGILIHVAVAYSMDLLALWHKGELGRFFE